MIGKSWMLFFQLKSRTLVYREFCRWRSAYASSYY